MIEALIAIAIIFSVTVVVLAVIYARALQQIVRLSKVSSLQELPEERPPTKVTNSIKQAMMRAYSTEDR